MHIYALRHNIRFYILITSIGLSLVIYGWIETVIPAGIVQIIKLEQIYAFLALVYLYITLLIGPFCYTFRSFPLHELLIKARRALGVSAFYFSLLHSLLAFFGQLRGFSGLGFLSNTYFVAVSIGFFSLVILVLLTITSFDYAVAKMKFKNWKLLQRFVYLAGILILIHAVLLGTHFSDLSGITAQITFIALSFLLLLEAPRFDSLLKRFITIPQFGFSFVMLFVILGVIFFTSISPIISTNNGGISFDIHAAHRQLAQQALQQSQQNGGNRYINSIPGLQGDRTKRYTVSMTADPVTPQPNQDVTIRFKVYDASSGNRVTFFRILYAKPMHFIIVNSALTYFSHIHPTQENQDFVITTRFPKDDIYHLYIQFQPFGGIEQQVAFTLPVGQVPSSLTLSKAQSDIDKTKIFGDYAVSVSTHGGLNASAMSAGQQTITLSVTDTKTGSPVTNLKPYLASFGHLTLINEKTFDFIHVHPYSLAIPAPDANGGPTVDFLPIGIYGPFKSGIYRAFAEFNPDGKLFTADFTLEVQ